jgi:two-component system, chemotaxis family, response regulator Rcp1
MNRDKPQPIEILMVEDSPTDVLLAREALRHAKVLNHLHVVEDGVEAMAFLRREGPFADAPRPDLILLDFNLPRKDGREVLGEIKGDQDLQLIPVVVLTTSKAEEDVLRSYRLHANCFISKPVEFSSFATIIQSIENFWFSVVTLPRRA